MKRFHFSSLEKKIDRRVNVKGKDLTLEMNYKMQKDGEPVWDRTTIVRLWVTTQREAMIESGPPPTAATNPQPSGASPSEQKGQKEQTKK